MSSRSSKFKGLMDAVRPPESESTPVEPPMVVEVQPADATPAESIVEVTPAKRRGRPPGGKRNDPDYEQVTAYVRKRVHRDVKIALLQDEPRREFSELVDELLRKWLAERK